MRLVGIAGRAGSGKDTVADMMVADKGFQKTAFAKPIKDGCKAMFGLSDEQLYGELKETVIPEYGCTPREILQWAGTEFGRNMVHQNIWLMQVERQWRDLQALNSEDHYCPGLVVADVRFENEAAMIRRLGGLVVHVQRPDGTIASQKGYADHSSEQSLPVAPIDTVIDNSGSILQLRFNVNHLLDCMFVGCT